MVCCGLGKALAGKTHTRGEQQEGGKYALAVLAGINLLNFADRFVPGAVKGALKKELNLTDIETSFPMTAMIIVFVVFALIFGHLNDQQYFDRRKLLCGGVIIWSVATVLGGLAQNLTQLIVFRALVGVGEAAYGTIAPPMIADFFPHKDRIWAYTIYYIMSPVGGAIGFIIGSVVGSAAGWRVAFFVCGVPGILLGFLLLTINDPARGANDEESETNSTNSVLTDVKEILSNKHFVLATLGATCCTFTTGGFADWAPTFLVRFKGTSFKLSGLIMGLITVVGGIGGQMLGAQVTQRYKDRMRSAYFAVPGYFMLPCAFFGYMFVNSGHTQVPAFVYLLLLEICMFTHIAPINTALINVVPVRLRARALATETLILHVLGDVISPPIIGAISDATSSLRKGMEVTWVVPLLAGTIWIYASQFLPAVAGVCGHAVDSVEDAEANGLTVKGQAKKGIEYGAAI